MNLIIKDLVKKYNGQVILDHLSIDLSEIHNLALIGASGSGKSTLLRLLAGLESFDSGSITVNGSNLQTVNLEAYRKEIGFVFQDHNLFNHLSLLENICVILEKVHKRKRSEILPEIETLLTRFDLIAHQHKQPSQLSGGQAQRASIVRALSINPKLMLLDEPTSSLDPILTWEVLTAIRQLTAAHKDFVIVTHEIGFARQIADYILFMENGRIVEHGTPDMFNNPQTKTFEAFLSKVLSFNTV